MPDHIDELVPAFTEVMRGARDTSARSAGLGTGHVYGELTVDLTDDRVLGAHGLCDGGDRRGDGGPTPM